MSQPEHEEAPSIWSKPGPRLAARWLGLLAFMAVGFLYLSSGLVAPIWAALVLIGLWILMLLAIVKLWSTRPWHVFVSPIVALVLWVLTILAGEFFLGWTA